MSSRRQRTPCRRTSTGSNPTAFPSLLAMENALVGAAAALLGGGPDGVGSVVGNVTGGGTESLLLAVKAARDARAVTSTAAAAAGAAVDRARRVRQGGVLPAGRAWSRCRCRPRTLRPDPADVAAAITDRDRAGRVLGPVVRARGGRPGRGDRRRGGRAAACAATWTPASAAGCCPTCAGSGWPCRRSTSRCRGSRRSRSTCTSTRTARRASRSCCTGTRRCGRRSTSPTRTGRATRWSTRPMASTRSGRPDRGRLRDDAVPRRRRVPAAGAGHPGRGPAAGPGSVRCGRTATARRPD